MTSLTPEQLKQAKAAVRKVLIVAMMDGTLYKSDMFKFTQVYRG